MELSTETAARYARLPKPRFSAADADRAHDVWGANCGPGAIAAIAGMTLDELRPHLGDFESKRYTNPTLMWEVLNRTVPQWRMRRLPVVAPMPCSFPRHGLARIQWHGPWMLPNVPMKARYRMTHWVGSQVLPGGQLVIFDINAMCVGGWIPFDEWSGQLVPWLIREAVPRGNGDWSVSHSVEVTA